MADITVTSAQVGVDADAITRPYTTGAACTVGYAVYIDSSSYCQHAQNDVDSTQSDGLGVIVESFDGETSVASGDTCSVLLFGRLFGLSGMTPGASLYISSNAGRLTHTKPTAGWARAIGYALTATVAFINPEAGDPASA